MFQTTLKIKSAATKNTMSKFAKEHGCTLSDYQFRPDGFKSLTFKSKKYDYILELVDQLLGKDDKSSREKMIKKV
jgi:hypothetical protein